MKIQIDTLPKMYAVCIIIIIIIIIMISRLVDTEIYARNRMKYKEELVILT